MAAVQGASWAPHDRIAETLLRVALQSRFVTPQAVVAELRPQTKRRVLIVRVAQEVAGGATTRPEALLVSAWKRRRGLPPLRFQVPFIDASGRQRRLDAACLPRDFPGLSAAVALELEGIHHLDVRTAGDDALRSVGAAMRGIVPLRLLNHQVLADIDGTVDLLLATCRAWGWSG